MGDNIKKEEPVVHHDVSSVLAQAQQYSWLIPSGHNDESFEIGLSVKEVWEVSPSNIDTPEEFFKFFNYSDSLENIEKMGFIDFSSRIFSDDFYPLLSDPRKKTCLEIGFGGGRLLNAACKYFKKVIGVDIHNAFSRTSDYLKKSGCNNFELIHRDNFNLIKDNSVDFVYSFIVFQHFDKWSEVEYYLDQIDRVLSDDGCGILYFGINDINEKAYVEAGDLKVGDPFPFESADGIPSIKRLDARGYTLTVNPNFAVNEINKKFKTLEAAQGFKMPWNQEEASCQFYIKFCSKKHPITRINSNP